MIRLFQVGMSTQAQQKVGEVLGSGYIGQGPKVDEFEQALADTLMLPEPPLALNSCTSALDLALELIGVGPGDYVVTTPMTCTATNGVIVKRGATPLWADVNPSTGLISPRSVEEKVYRPAPLGRVKAIMVVDWAGTLANYDQLKSFGIPVIQDAAHSFGAGIGGDYVAWSFQAIKHLTTGDGGALLAPPEQMERGRLLRWYGLDRRSSASFRCAQNITEAGFKYHMNDIAAAIGLANLPMAVGHLRRHRENAEYIAKRLGLPFDPEGSYWFFPYLTERRDEFITFAAECGVETSPVHARNDKHTAFHFPNGPLPGTDYFDANFTALPCGWWLTPEDLETIVACVRAWRASL